MKENEKVKLGAPSAPVSVTMLLEVFWSWESSEFCACVYFTL